MPMRRSSGSCPPRTETDVSGERAVCGGINILRDAPQRTAPPPTAPDRKRPVTHPTDTMTPHSVFWRHAARTRLLALIVTDCCTLLH